MDRHDKSRRPGSPRDGGLHHTPAGPAGRDDDGLEVWAIEPYFGGSHKAFLDGLARHSRHAVTLFTLPGRHWKWRMHGGALSLARQVADHARRGGPSPEVFFTSDMLDLPVFLAMLPPALGRVPTLLYFHENQLTYPLPPGVERDLGYGLKNLASAAAAGSVLFNSEFHRREFLSAVTGLLAGMPDEIPRWVAEEIEAKSAVVPVGCDLRRFDKHRDKALSEAHADRWGDPAQGPLLLWNQRWEYDKAPDELFQALYALQASGVPFRLAMAGPNQGTPTAAFLRAKEELASRLVQWGKVSSASDYASLLWSADVVVSTAIHEFFGVAVVEAIYCGCRPVLPRRLSYPELVPGEVHDEVLYGEGELVSALAEALARSHAWSDDWQRTWVVRFDWGNLRSRYDEEMRRCWETATHPRGQGHRGW